MGGSKNLPPDWLAKAKFIWFFLLNGCGTSLMVYIKTGVYASERMAMSLVAFDMLDMARGLLRPKATRNTAHGSRAKKNKGKGKATAGIPELPEMISDGARSIGGFEKPKYSSGLNHLWDIDGITQRGLYKIMIVSIIQDFAFDWYSGIIAAPESDCGLGRGRIQSNLEIVASGGWGPFVLNDLIFEQLPVQVLTTEFKVGPGTYFVALQAFAKVRPGPYPDQLCQLALLSDTVNFVTVATSDRMTVTQGDKVTFMCENIIEGPMTIAFYQYAEVGGIDWTEVLAFCFQMSD